MVIHQVYTYVSVFVYTHNYLVSSRTAALFLSLRLKLCSLNIPYVHNCNMHDAMVPRGLGIGCTDLLLNKKKGSVILSFRHMRISNDQYRGLIRGPNLVSNYSHMLTKNPEMLSKPLSRRWHHLVGLMAFVKSWGTPSLSYTVYLIMRYRGARKYELNWVFEWITCMFFLWHV